MTETEVQTEAEQNQEGQSAAPPVEQEVQQGEAAEQVADQQEQQTTDEGTLLTEGEGEGDDGGESPLGAPEDDYEFEAPEGYEFDPDVLTAYSEVAKELDLTQKSAQKVLDKVGPALRAQHEAQVEKVRNEWAETSRADPEFGGEKLDTNLTVAKTALDKFGSDGLKQLLSDTGLGNNPEVIRLLFRIGNSISEDSVVSDGRAGKSPPPAPSTFAEMAERFYPNQNSE